MLLNICARSVRDLSLRREMCQDRISRLIALTASLLTAGRKFTKCLPHLFLASRGRNVYPRKRERRGLMITAPVGVLTVHDAGLPRMQFQADFRQSPGQGIPYHHGLLLAGAVNHRIIT